MPVSVDLSGLDRLTRRIRAMAEPNAHPLMRRFERIIAEDNLKGVLAGTDKDGKPLAPTTYRPKPPPSWYAINPSKLKARQRNNVRAGRKRGEFAGFGPMAAGINNNLTSSEYRYLTGPPMAPRGKFSRVITNLFTAHGRDPASYYRWAAIGAWREVVSKKGVPFLKAHFDGIGHLPRRDLRGVRPEGVALARLACIEWMKSIVREENP